MKKFFRIAALLFASLFFLTACASTQTHLWVKSPGWSRAAFLGSTGASNPVSLLPTEEGVYALLLPVEQQTKTYHLRLLCFHPDTAEMDTVEYPEISPSPPTQLAMSHRENANSFYWIDDGALYAATSDLQGNWLTPPHLLFDKMQVEHFVLLQQDDAPLLIVSGPRRAPGVFAVEEDGASTRLSEKGVMARAALDSAGNLHLLWAVYPVGYGDSYLVYAARHPGESWNSLSAQRIANLPLTTSTRLESLALGVDESAVSIFWTTSIAFGLEAGSVSTQYLSFPLDSASAVPPQKLYAPMVSKASFTSPQFQDLRAGQAIDLNGEPLPSTNALEDLSVAPQASSELTLAYRAGMLHLWHKRRFQVNLLYLQDGQPTYFQPISFTASYSLNPSVARDEEGWLYMSWLEKVTAEHYDVYFTSTNPEIVKAFSALSWQERGNIALKTLFGLLIGSLLAPIAASLWMLALFAVQGIFALLRRWIPASWKPAWETISIAASLLVYWEVKQATLPDMFRYVPFSAWIPNIPAAVGDVLRYAVPIVIFLLAFYAAWRYTYRKGHRTVLYFLMVYLGVDALLTMAIYAVLIYGIV